MVHLIVLRMVQIKTLQTVHLLRYRQSKRVEKIAPRFKAAKEVLTQDEKAYIDRLTQELTYNFLYAQ